MAKIRVRYFVLSLFIGAFSPVEFVPAPLRPMLPPVPMPVPAPVVPGVARSGIAFVLPWSAPAPGSVGDGVVGLTLGPDWLFGEGLLCANAAAGAKANIEVARITVVSFIGCSFPAFEFPYAKKTSPRTRRSAKKTTFRATRCGNAENSALHCSADLTHTRP